MSDARPALAKSSPRARGPWLRWLVASLAALFVLYFGMLCVSKLSGYFLDSMWDAPLEEPAAP